MDNPITLAARSAYDAHLTSLGSHSSAGIVVRDRADLQIATVIALKGHEALAASVRSTYGLDLPNGPRRVASRGAAFVAIGPRTWLATREGGGSLADELRQNLGSAAAVSDQSSGYAVLHLSGSRVRATFEKGLAIDVHPRAFRPGDAAVTTCAHMSLVLWQLDDAPSYEVAVPRSLAASFWHWLSESAAEYGLKVEPPLT